MNVCIIYTYIHIRCVCVYIYIYKKLYSLGLGFIGNKGYAILGLCRDSSLLINSKVLDILLGRCRLAVSVPPLPKIGSEPRTKPRRSNILVRKACQKQCLSIKP